jgi:hypothetical protein
MRESALFTLSRISMMPAGKPSPEALDAWAAEGQLRVETRTAA